MPHNFICQLYLKKKSLGFKLIKKKKNLQPQPNKDLSYITNATLSINQLLNFKIASSGREYIETYDWFALCGRGQHNIVEQLSFNLKKII